MQSPYRRTDHEAKQVFGSTKRVGFNPGKKKVAFSSGFFRALMDQALEYESRVNASMKNIDLNSMSIEELWALHEEIASILTAKMEAEKLKLQKRLEQIERRRTAEAPERRTYPKVHPKFRNPDPPHQTWSGRGLQPNWMRKLLAEGKTADDLRVSPRSGSPREN